MLWDALRCACIIEGTSGAEVKVVLIGIPEERVGSQILVKVLVKIKQPDYVQLERIYLIEKPVLHVSAVSVRRGNYVSGVFRTALVIV